MLPGMLGLPHFQGIMNQANQRVPTSPNLTGDEHKLIADFRRANANGQALISRTAASVAGLCTCVNEG